MRSIKAGNVAGTTPVLLKVSSDFCMEHAEYHIHLMNRRGTFIFHFNLFKGNFAVHGRQIAHTSFSLHLYKLEFALFQQDKREY